MTRFKKWFTQTLHQVIDPDKEERIAKLTAILEQQLQSQRKEFSLDEFIEQVDHTTRDLESAKRKVFDRVLQRAWKDDELTPGEQKTLEWVADCLRIPRHEAVSRQLTVARNRFAIAIAQAMDDGVFEDHEAAFLETLAASTGHSLGEFVRKFFLAEGEQFLRGIFTACTEDGVLADDAWNRLVTTAKRLGLSEVGLTDAIRQQAQRFIEHVLADAKSDGKLSEAEESYLTALIRKLDLPPSLTDYVRRHINDLRIIRLANQGTLPVLASPTGVAIRAGEIVHYYEPARWIQKRILKSGDRWDQHEGMLTITDNRLLFSGTTKSFDVRFAKIVGFSGKTGIVSLQRVEKPESAVFVDEVEPVLHAILDGAIALSNQTRLARQSGDKSRHIPREVRQRVWQRYGGQCAECGATDYLEFDHIVPVAKGGSNSDANVQLLCRACNLKKSDFI